MTIKNVIGVSTSWTEWGNCISKEIWPIVNQEEKTMRRIKKELLIGYETGKEVSK